MRSSGWGAHPTGLGFLQEEETPKISICAHTEVMWGHRVTVRKQLSASQEDSPHQKPNLPGPWPGTSSLHCEKNKCLLFELTSLSCFVMAAWVDFIIHNSPKLLTTQMSFNRWIVKPWSFMSYGRQNNDPQWCPYPNPRNL